MMMKQGMRIAPFPECWPTFLAMRGKVASGPSGSGTFWLIERQQQVTGDGPIKSGFQSLAAPKNSNCNRISAGLLTNSESDYGRVYSVNLYL